MTAVGVMGDKRVHGFIVALRAVVTTDFMTAEAFDFERSFWSKVSTKIGNEVDGITRVVWDDMSKPLVRSSGNDQRALARTAL